MSAPRVPDHSCLGCQVRQGTICAPLTDAQLHEVEAIRARDQVVARGTDLFVQGERGENFYTIKKGWVMLYTLLADGRRQIQGFGLPGAFLGADPDEQAPMQYAAQALTDVELCVLPRTAVSQLFKRMPDLAVSFACVAWHAREQGFQQLTNVGRRSARERIAFFLLSLAGDARHASASGGHTAPALPITQEHIADALGLTSVHVSRMLKELREEGLVSTRGHLLDVLDEGRLRTAAGLER